MSDRTAMFRLAFTGAVLLGLTGCDKEITGPTPTVGEVRPPVVCQAQLDTWVEISGDSFSPLPTDAMTDAPRLVLPEVALLPSLDIDGNAVEGDPIVIPDDPAAPDDSHILWTAPETMSFEVYADPVEDPVLELDTGLYGIRVTNANSNTNTLEDSFLAVPPPRVDRISPDLVCGDQDNVLTLTGDFFLRFADGPQPTVDLGSGVNLPVASMAGCRALPGPSGTDACTEVTVDLRAGTLSAGAETYANFDVVLHNTGTAPCISEQDIVLTVVPRPTYDSIVPDLICVAEGDNPVTVSGTGFLRVDDAHPTLLVGSASFPTTVSAGSCTPVLGPAAQVESCTELTSTIPMDGLLVDVYDNVAVQNPTPADCTSIPLGVLAVVAPPTVSSATRVPPPPGSSDICLDDRAFDLVIDGFDFLVVDDGSGPLFPSVTFTGDSVQSVSPAAFGDMGGCVEVTGPVETVQRCTSMVVTLPQAVTGRQTLSVRVTNPPTAACSSASAPPVVVENWPLPAVAMLGEPPQTPPIQICQGGDTLTIHGQDLRESATVTLVDPTRGTSETALDVTGTAGCVNELCTSIEAQLGPLPGEFIFDSPLDLLVENAPGCGFTLADSIIVTQGPLILYADPPMIYDGMDNTLTVYAANFVSADIDWVHLIADSDGTTISLCDDTVVGRECPDLSGPESGIFNIIVPADIVRDMIAGSPDSETFDMEVKTGDLTCTGTLANAVRILLTPEPGSHIVVTPSNGKVGTDTAVTLSLETAPATGPFAATPRAFVTNGTTGRPLRAVTFVDAATLNAIVPSTLELTPGCTGDVACVFEDFDLIVITPDGRLIIEESDTTPTPPVFRLSKFDPPRIAELTPGQLPAGTAADIQINGTGFSGDPTTGVDTRDPPAVTLSCTNAAGTAVTGPAVTNVFYDASDVLTFHIGTGGVADTACVVTVTNDEDQTVDSFAAIVFGNPSGNIPGGRLATFDHDGNPTTRAWGVLQTARRAPGVQMVGATRAARFMWVAGGDAGTVAGATNSVERAPVSLTGSLGLFESPRYAMETARTQFGFLAAGRALYAIGGANATSDALGSVERAVVLDPSEVVNIDVDSFRLVPGGTGMLPGGWIYRSTIVYDASDPIHPCGESLPSEPFVMNIPALANEEELEITLGWETPDPAMPSSQWTNRVIAGYRLYRTTAPDQGLNDLLFYLDIASAGPGTDTFVDTAIVDPASASADLGCGAVTPGDPAVQPPKVGDTTRWVSAGVPQLNQARVGSGFQAVVEPVSGRVFLYAMSGVDAAGAGLTDYELLVLEHDPTTNPTLWETTGWQRFTGILQSPGGGCTLTARTEAALYAFNDKNSSVDGIDFKLSAGEHYLVFGPGHTPAGGLSSTTESWQIDTTNGRLLTATWDGACTQALAGYGDIAANAQFFLYGGDAGTDAIRAGEICPGLATCGAVVDLGNPNNNGAFKMVQPRYQHGSILDRAFIYHVGGVLAATGVPYDTVELGIW